METWSLSLWVNLLGHTNPFIVLSVVSLVVAKKIFIREKPQHIGLLWVLQLVEKFGGLKYPSVLGYLDQNLTSLYSVTFAVQILYTTFNS